MRAEIYHLYHSGVAIKIGNDLLIFDYYLDKPEADGRGLVTGVISENDLRKAENIYVFVSHHHGDHYNPVIFNWQEINHNINYILSDDINLNFASESIAFMGQDEELNIDELLINTFGSTDQGISFLVKINDMAIFHAGDLNWWHWESFSEAELNREETDFKNEIKKLNERKVDIAFVPVDPRLGDYYYLAGEYFIQEIKPDLLIPIHFADNFIITRKFAEKMKPESSKVAIIEERGEKILYE